MPKYLNILYLVCCFIFFDCSLQAKEEEEKKDTEKNEEEEKDAEKKEPPKIGNFSLPSSQQPSGLFAFGGNIIDEGQTQLTFFSDAFSGKNRCIIDTIPGILYGITENSSILFNFVTTPKFMDKNHCSNGPQDFYAQFEYAIYNETDYTFADQVTVVANMTLPTGSIKKNPPTGYGSPSFFIGGTYYHTTVNWVFFTTQGAILTTSNHHSKIGNFFLYQFGMARNLPSPKGWIYAGILELDGQYNKKNRINGRIKNDSGGNAIYLTPSFWISSKELVLQFGMSFPVYQNLFGRQGKFDYAFNLNFGWSFYKK